MSDAANPPPASDASETIEEFHDCLDDVCREMPTEVSPPAELVFSGPKSSTDEDSIVTAANASPVPTSHHPPVAPSGLADLPIDAAVVPPAVTAALSLESSKAIDALWERLQRYVFVTSAVLNEFFLRSADMLCEELLRYAYGKSLPKDYSAILASDEDIGDDAVSTSTGGSPDSIVRPHRRRGHCRDEPSVGNVPVVLKATVARPKPKPGGPSRASRGGPSSAFNSSADVAMDTSDDARRDNALKRAVHETAWYGVVLQLRSDVADLVATISSVTLAAAAVEPNGAAGGGPCSPIRGGVDSLSESPPRALLPQLIQAGGTGRVSSSSLPTNVVVSCGVESLNDPKRLLGESKKLFSPNSAGGGRMTASDGRVATNDDTTTTTGGRDSSSSPASAVGPDVLSAAYDIIRCQQRQLEAYRKALLRSEQIVTADAFAAPAEAAPVKVADGQTPPTTRRQPPVAHSSQVSTRQAATSSKRTSGGNHRTASASAVPSELRASLARNPPPQGDSFAPPLTEGAVTTLSLADLAAYPDQLLPQPPDLSADDAVGFDEEDAVSASTDGCDAANCPPMGTLKGMTREAPSAKTQSTNALPSGTKGALVAIHRTTTSRVNAPPASAGGHKGVTSHPVDPLFIASPTATTGPTPRSAALRKAPTHHRDTTSSVNALRAAGAPQKATPARVDAVIVIPSSPSATAIFSTTGAIFFKPSTVTC